jgi:4-amino-4-deoxy-L-arabinose transferase-like glycosyltransferase
MQTKPPAPMPADGKSLTARIGWLVLIVATLYVCYFSHLGAIGFAGPDEPRYAWIARAMAENGDWVTPRLYGKPWFEKPPLYYWGAALSFKLFGVSEAAARLPSAVSALLATLALAWLALRIYGAETARWLLLLLPTTVGMIGFSHAAATDMPFSAMLTIAMVAAAVLVRLVPPENSPSAATKSVAQPSFWSLAPFTSSPYFADFLFGLFLGLAVLAKGPAGVILCGGAVWSWALVTKRWRDALRLLHPAAVVTFCVTALPWYILCAHRNPDFLRIFIIEHNFKRFLTPEFQHNQPFWFYLEIILLAFLPWTAALMWTLVVGLRRLTQAKGLTAFTYYLLCWTGFCVVFFSFSRSKLPGYILPAVPAIALILSHSIATLASAKHRSFCLASLAAAALFAGLAMKVYDERLLKNLVAFAPLFALVLGAFALANCLLGVLFLFSRRNIALLAGTLPILLLFALVDEILPFTPVSILSPRYLAYQLEANHVPLAELRVAGIRRSALYGLNFYLRTDLQEWERDSAQPSYVIATGRLPCSKIPENLNCSNLWGEIGKVDDFELLHLTPNASAARPR